MAFLSLERQVSSGSSQGPSSGDFSSPSHISLEQVDQSLSCAVCLSRYKDPRLLSCDHSFCAPCLQRMVSSQGFVDDAEIVCPKCRQTTRLGAGGVTTLHKNYALEEAAAALPSDITFTPSAPVNPRTEFQKQLSAIPQCDKHRRPLEFFCRVCDTLVCPDCLIGNTHRHHDVVKVVDVLPEQLEILRDKCYEASDRTLLKISVALDEVTNAAEAIKEKGEAKKSEIQKYFRDIRRLLQKREQVLLESTDEIVMAKVAVLSGQRERLEQAKSDLKEQVKYLNVLLETPNCFHYLKNKSKIVADATETIKMADSLNCPPLECTKDGPSMNLPSEYLEKAKTLGEVFCQPCPSKFTAQGEGLSKAFVDSTASFTIKAHDRYGKRSFVSGSLVDVTVQGPDPSVTTFCKIDEVAKGEYLVTYIPTSIGYHVLNITVDDKQICADKQHIVVFKSKDYLSLSVPQTQISKSQIVSDPPVSTMRGVCHLPNGNIVFTDAFCLRVINPSTGRLVRTIGSYGTEPGQFLLPLGLAANQQGVIFVSDTTNNKIEKFTSEGRHIAVIGAPGVKGALTSPEGLALYGDEKIFVADQGNHRIVVFLQRNGRYVTNFGKRGREAGQFIEPRDVAVDLKNNRVFVSDKGNHRIQAFTPEGKPLLKFGNRCSIPLNSPNFVCVDPDGFILITQTQSSVVTILTHRGSLICHLKHPFRSPYGIAVGNKGQMIVTDSALLSVQIF